MDYILQMNEIVAVHGYSYTLCAGMICTGTLVKSICKDVIANMCHAALVIHRRLDFFVSLWCIRKAG